MRQRISRGPGTDDTVWADDTWESSATITSPPDIIEAGERPADPVVVESPVVRRRSPTRHRRAARIGRGVSLALVAIVVLAALALATRRPLTPGAAVDATPVNVTPVGGAVETPAPRPTQLARAQGVSLYVPVYQDAITAILYHRVDGSDTIPLDPVGQLQRGGLIQRIERDLLGVASSGVEYSIADGSVASVDVGAAAGTPVFTPVEGRIVGIVPNIVNGKPYGSIVTIQPSTNPGVVVVLSNIEVRADVRVGDEVAPTSADADATRLGTVLDMSPVLDQLLASYTRDEGNHVHTELRINTTSQVT